MMNKMRLLHHPSWEPITWF